MYKTKYHRFVKRTFYNLKALQTTQTYRQFSQKSDWTQSSFVTGDSSTCELFDELRASPVLAVRHRGV